MRRAIIAAFIVVSCCSLTYAQPMQPGGGLPVASTVQLPTFGVSIDAAGVLSLRRVVDPGGRLRAARAVAAAAARPPALRKPSACRMVSLTRLEAAIRRELAAGRSLDDTMLNLAGLLRVEFAFLFTDTNEIVIAGPAEGWVDDGAGRRIGLTTGRPVVQLEDLVVALRAFPAGDRGRPFVGCTISPDRNGLRRLQEFQRTIPRSVPQNQRTRTAIAVAKGMRDALGMAHIRVFGISPKTRMAQVLIEADYRMKLIGVGVEPPPVKMKTFVNSLSGSKQSGLQRWWFTPHYECLKMSADRHAMQLVGRGVQLQTEDKTVGPDGRAIDSGRPPSKAAQTYASSFTARYSDISAAQPVYAELRNEIDLLTLGAFLQHEDWYSQVGWKALVLNDEAAVKTETKQPATDAQCVANSIWKGARMFSPAGGGVSIQPHR
ncbi:MAG: DUF1598 domain-containing protein, partial [Pirellulaceae bacterium]|nr:DUF1598 domain-containing protein [Pirellulaceae bacterium]